MSKPTAFRTQPDFHGDLARHSSLIELGRMMRVERERHGLTHDQFAQALGIHASEVVRLERGDVSPMA